MTNHVSFYRHIVCIFVSLSLSLALLPPAVSHSEDSQTSELHRVGTENGKPYRIDSSGHRISDYLAELEITIQELRNKVATLEDEIKKRDELTTSSPSGIVTNKSDTNKPESAPVSIDPSPREPTSDNWAVNPQSAAWKNAPKALSPTECAHLVVPLNQRINRLEQVLALQNQNTRNPNGTAECDRSAIEKPLVDRIVRLEQERASLSAQALGLSSKNDQDTRILKAELDLAHSEIVRLTTENNLAKEQLASAELGRLAQTTPAQTTPAQTTPAQTTPAQTTPSRAGQESIKQESTQVSSETIAANINETEKAEDRKATKEETTDPDKLQEMQRSLSQNLTTIQSLVIERKNALDRQKKAAPGISVSISPLVSHVGHSLDDLRVQAIAKPTASQITLLNNEANEIKKILEGDIQILKGLAKM